MTELIRIDMEHCWKRGDFIQVNNYLKEFAKIFTPGQPIPDSLVTTQYELEWETNQSGTGRDRPRISNYIESYSTNDPSSLFWKLAEIDLEFRTNRCDSQSLDIYLDQFEEIFQTQPVVPLHLVKSHFAASWNSSTVPAIDEYKQLLSPNDSKAGLGHLIQIDMRCCWKAGEPKWIEHYIQCFPEIFHDDGYLPQDLVTEELTLAKASRISHEDLRCPYCQTFQNGESNPDTCRSCGRNLNTPPIEIDVPEYYGQFQIIRPLGEGGFGTVYKAWARLGFLYEEMGQSDLALKHWRKALRVYKKTVGNDHSDTVNLRNHLEEYKLKNKKGNSL